MADLLLELFSEEIPARMQAQAAKDLERLVIGALSDRGLLFEAAKPFSGPRRLTLAINGLPAKQPDVSEEKKGPRINAPEKAIEGFLRSAGVTLDQCEKRDDGKGEFYVAVIARKGRDTAEVLAEVLPETFAKLPWPKSMQWNVFSRPGTGGYAVSGGYGVKGAYGSSIKARWVRPLHGIVCTLDGEVVPFEFAGVKSGDVTYGHRFLSQGPIEVRRFEDYEKKLHDAYVLIDPARRKEIIWEDAKAQAFVHNLEPIADEGLLEEVSGLAEWPVVLTGKIEDQFMDVPAEILQTSMRTHQKYFSTRDPKTGRLANRFIVVANMMAKDGGKEIVAGNERVLRARLSDAKFFWGQDRQTKLADRVDALKGIRFHAKLGTQYERVERIEALAGEIAEKIGADVAKAKRAARLCKADLTTGVVGEFPELQGVMGRYYALHDGEPQEVVSAIREHYRPLGPSDIAPVDKVAVAVALADKLDQICGLFGVLETPSGSSDPFALRRAALGLVRILFESNLRVSVGELLRFDFAFIWTQVELDLYETLNQIASTRGSSVSDLISFLNNGLWCYVFSALGLLKRIDSFSGTIEKNLDEKEGSEEFQNLWYEILGVAKSFDLATAGPSTLTTEQRSNRAKVELGQERVSLYAKKLSDEIGVFIADRLKVALRARGTRHDLIDAVFILGNEDDLVRLVARVEALQVFLKSDDGANLLTAYKRAANILRAEEKRDETDYSGSPDPEAFVLPEEKALFVELATASELIRAEVQRERFVEAMGVMARLRKPVDAFFDKVTVNDKDPALRKNRLLLLSRLRATLHLVADFSKIEG